MAIRMAKNMLALPILGVFLALGVGVAIWYASAEPAPPKDLEEYLQRELERLQDADAEDLNESARNIKAALGDAADTDDLVVAYFNESMRRHRVYYEQRGSSPYRPPEVSGEAAALQKAIDCAKAVESALGYDAYNRFKEGMLTSSDEDVLLRESQPILRLIGTVLAGEPVRVPDSGLMVQGSEIGTTWTTGLGRVLAMRTAILAKREQWQDAQETARLAVSLPGHIHQGHSAIVWAVEVVSWFAVLDECLVRPTWSETELTKLLNHVNLRELDLADLLRAEASYVETFYLTPVTHSPEQAEILRIGMESVAEEMSYPPLEELIDREIVSLGSIPDRRRAAADWIDASRGDLLDSNYLVELNAGLSDVDDTLWISYICDWGELVMLRDCARLKLMWLKGKRGADFASEAERIAAEHGLIEFKIEARSFTATQNPRHELSRRGHSFEPYTVTLTD